MKINYTTYKQGDKVLFEGEVWIVDVPVSNYAFGSLKNQKDGRTKTISTHHKLQPLAEYRKSKIDDILND